MIGKRGRKPKYNHIVLLKGVNARELFKEFKQAKREIQNNAPLSQIVEYNSHEQEPTQLTDISKGQMESKATLDTIQDGTKVIMADIVNYGCLPDRTDIWCRYCNHSFNTSPIGIPIEYSEKKPDKIQLEDGKASGINDFFYTDKIFCSFPCCLRFINDHQHKTEYKFSKALLYAMYYKIYGHELKIEPAGDLDKLTVHGGYLDINEFRDKYCSCNYVITDSIKRPYMVAVGRYTEQTRCGIL